MGEQYEAEMRRRRALERAAQGGSPLRYAVRFELDGGERRDGILEITGAAVRLVEREVGLAFDAGIGELEKLSFPPHRGSQVRIRVSGHDYKLWLHGGIWLTEEEGPAGPLDVELELHPVEEMQLMTTNWEALETVGTLYEIGAAALISVGTRFDRRDVKRALTQETPAEQIAAENARTLLEHSEEPKKSLLDP